MKSMKWTRGSLYSCELSNYPAFVSHYTRRQKGMYTDIPLSADLRLCTMQLLRRGAGVGADGTDQLAKVLGRGNSCKLGLSDF